MGTALEKQRRIPSPKNLRESVVTLEIALRNDHFTMHSPSIFCQHVMNNSKNLSDFRFVLRLSPDIDQPSLLRYFQRRAAGEAACRTPTSRNRRICHGKAVDAVELENEWTAGEFNLDEG